MQTSNFPTSSFPPKTFIFAFVRIAYRRIVKDKIGDACVRLAFNQDETWTKALKYILTNAKWILAYASNLSDSSEDNNSMTRR